MPSGFDRDFLSPAPLSRQAYETAMAAAQRVILRDYASLDACYGGPEAAELAGSMAALEICPEDGAGLEATLDLVGRLVLRNSVMVSDPTCLGHLHCPPLIAGLAAESLISAINQSMDSWDQAPAATYLEQRMTDWLCGLFGLGGAADGIFTSGGTQSNFMGILLARDVYAERRLGWRIQDQGLPPEAASFRLLCSEDAHFSIRQSLAILGLGEQAAVAVPTDPARRMDVAAAERSITELLALGLRPIAIAATAGTTDSGSIDPLPQVADLAARHGLWLHIDAAYGGGLVLSERHAPRLDGIERADSLTVDFHKLFYQPISCSTLLVRDRACFDAIRLHADYLNPPENEAAGLLDLVTKSLQTTRRFDGLKPFVTLRALGRRHLAAMIDATIALAVTAALRIEADPELHLACRPALNAVLLRYRADGATDDRLDAVNGRIPARLMASGRALLAKTRFDGRVFLKMTLLNPRTTPAHIDAILAAVKECGRTALEDLA